MRRAICMILALLLALPVFAAAEQGGGTTAVRCEAQGYTTLADPGWRVEWADGDGMYFHLGEDNMPYVLLWFNPTESRITDGESYLRDRKLPELKESYGQNGAIMLTQHGGFSVGGRPVAAADVQYHNRQGLLIYLLVVVDVREDFTAIFHVRYLEESGRQQALDALELIDANLALDGADVPEPPTGAPRPPAELGEYGVRAAPSIVPETTPYACAEFTATLPVGWKLETGGLFENFSFRCYDPNQPERCLFLMSQAGVMHKSQAGKDWWVNYPNGLNFQKPLIDNAIVLPEPSVACFIQNMEAFRASLATTYPMGLSAQALPPEVAPDINRATIWEISGSDALRSYIDMLSKITLYNAYPDASVVRFGCVSSNGISCEGLAGGVVIDCRDPYYLNPSLDVWFYLPACFMGFTAPAGELQALEPTLAACLDSFRFTEGYLRQARQNSQMLAELIGLQDAWNGRDQSYDVLSQKYSDATLGYDRLYDSETGEVYRADLDFYDGYDLHRGEFSNPNLYRIDGGNERYYLEGVDYYITK